MISKQFFDRSRRLKPIWKSETEFRNLERENLGNRVARSFKNTLKAIKNNTFYVNDIEYEKAKAEKIESERTLEETTDLMKEVVKNSIKTQVEVLKVFEIFKEFAEKNKLKNDFAFIYVDKHYESNYSKLGSEEIYIEFIPDRVIPVQEALAVEAKDSSAEEKTGYYYIYTSKENINSFKEQRKDIAKELFLFIGHKW